MTYFVVTNHAKSYDVTHLDWKDDTQWQKNLKKPDGKSYIGDWDASQAFIVKNEDVLPSDYIYHGGIYIVSKRFYNLLNEFAKPNLLEFLPIQIIYKNQNYGEYGRLNFTRTLNALDIDKCKFSEVDDDEETPDLIKIDLDTKKIAGNKIFMQDDLEPFIREIIIDSDINQSILANKIRGLKPIPVKQWRAY